MAKCNKVPKIAGHKVHFIGAPSKLTRTDWKEMSIEWPRSPLHLHTFGKLTKFFEGLKKGELWGTRCANPKCGEKGIWLPPRADCPDCLQPMKWVKFKNPVIGEIFTFTYVEYPGQGIELSTPYYQIDVKIPGCCTIMKGYLVRGKAEIGMKVKAGFRTENPVNNILDLYWEPLD